MKGIKLELLGLSIILLGITSSLNNFWGYIFGVLGTAFAFVGYIWKERDN